MKIGLCAWSFTGAHREAGRKLDPFVPEDLARLALDRGLRSIECAPGPLQEKTPAELEAFKEFLARHELDIILDTGSPDLSADTAPLRTALETAHKIGAPVIRTTISDLLEGDRRRCGLEGWKAHLQAQVEPLGQIAAQAEDYGIHVGIENHQDLSSGELCWLCEEVDSPALGVTMDCGNALAVGETPARFARRIMPFLKHVHLKDYTVHPTPSGYRFKRCAIGAGVVEWPELLAAFATSAPQVLGCIELGSSSSRHIRILEADYWSTYPPPPLSEAIDAIRTLHRAARPAEDWRTPHERGESARKCTAYELEQVDASVEYLRRII